MANATTYIGVKAGSDINDLSGVSIAGASPGVDFEFKFSATDANGNTLTRLDALIALDRIRTVLESNDLYTTEMEQ